MPEKYQETEMSKKAKSILENLVKSGDIPEDSSFGRDIKYTLKYNPKLIPQFSNKKGLDTNRIYVKTIMPNDDDEFSRGVLLLKRCIEFNLTEEQAHEVIKERYRYFYKNISNQEFAISTTKKCYPEWGKDVEITPDPNFPDW